MSKLKDEFLEEIIDLHLNKKISIRQISLKFGVSTWTVNNFLKKHNIENINFQKIRNYDVEQDIIPLFNQGMSNTKIGKILNISRKVVAKRLKEKGLFNINRQNEIKINENIFDKIDTEEKAYWLGFLFADGTVSKSTNRVAITLKESDKEHLNKFNKFISHKKNNVHLYGLKNCNICTWTINSYHLKNTLINYGCIPNKTYNLKYPENFYDKMFDKHFIRGFFDGDGCITYQSKELKNGTRYYKAVCKIAGNPKFLNELSNKIPFETHLYIKDQNNSELDVSHKYTNDFLHYLYDESSIYLNRKYERFLFFKDRKISKEEMEIFLKTK